MTGLIFYYSSTVKLRGSCLYWYAHVGFGSQQSFLAGDRKEEGVVGGADLILLSSGAAAFRCVPATVLLLHLPFVYFKVRKKRKRGWLGETHIFSSLRVLLYSP